MTLTKTRKDTQHRRHYFEKQAVKNKLKKRKKDGFEVEQNGSGLLLHDSGMGRGRGPLACLQLGAARNHGRRPSGREPRPPGWLTAHARRYPLEDRASRHRSGIPDALRAENTLKLRASASLHASVVLVVTRCKTYWQRSGDAPPSPNVLTSDDFWREGPCLVGDSNTSRPSLVRPSTERTPSIGYFAPYFFLFRQSRNRLICEFKIRCIRTNV